MILSLCDVPGEYVAPKGRSILWVSRCIPRKGPERFVRLAKAFPELEFVMIMNDGPDPAYNAQVSELAAGAGNLLLVDHVPYQQVEDYYRRARVLANTSDFEGFPNTFLQAMKYGVPILSFSVDPNEVVSGRRVGMVATGDLGRMERQLAQIVRDDDTFHDLSRNAFHYVKEHHDIHTLAGQYRAMIG